MESNEENSSDSTILPLSFWIVLFCFLVSLPSIVFARPIAAAVTTSGSITIYNEPCAIAEISNLPVRVTWETNGKVLEGCAGSVPDLGIVMMYFPADKTVEVLRLSSFSPIREL